MINRTEFLITVFREGRISPVARVFDSQPKGYWVRTLISTVYLASSLSGVAHPYLLDHAKGGELKTKTQIAFDTSSRLR